MESVSRSSRGFADDEEEEDEYTRGEGSFQKGDLTVKIDGKNVEQKQPSTPRSKHSATEQRRRSKINDRFQILRDLIPNSDQKRDKASFLLEVIEYIRFLQEKVQKYESYPDMPWVKTFFRSLWKNAMNNTQGPGDGPAAPGYMFAGNDNNISIPPGMLSNMQNPAESESQQRLGSDSSNVASQSQWVRPFPSDGTVNSDVLNEQEELIIDEGTISVSHTYSQGLLAALTQSLESSGLDLSQASISVQINLGKRAKRLATTMTSSAKDPDDPSPGNRVMEHSMVGSSGEESGQASKRHKMDNDN
uniref:BHLH transcription factor n=1 Tax=Dracaena cambodiana TaxID=580341 RepID=A0A7M3UQM0_9ASPA|nr:bHLH transcription factor [Dracaena cambodiana]